MVKNTDSTTTVPANDPATKEGHSAPAGRESQGIPLSALTPAQLANVKESLDLEINALTNHVVELRHAVRCLKVSQNALKGLGPDNEGREALVPLTQSVYVPAALVDTDKVLVDIGTGYFAERSISQADAHFGRRIQTIQDTCSKALKVITEKKRVAEVLSQQMS